MKYAYLHPKRCKKGIYFEVVLMKDVLASNSRHTVSVLQQ